MERTDESMKPDSEYSIWHKAQGQLSMYLDLEHIMSQCILHVELLQTKAQSAFHMWERWSTLYFSILLIDMAGFTDTLVCKACIFLITNLSTWKQYISHLL